MGNLENILHEKEDESAKVKSAIASALHEEEKKYRERVKEFEKQECLSLSKLNNNYAPKLTEAIIADLTNDSQVMIERSKYFSFTKEKIEEAINLKKNIEDLKSRAKSKREFEKPLNALLAYLPQETKDLINIPDLENVKEEAQITTYVSSNGEMCYVLTPITDKPLDKLSKDMEDKLLGVINVKRVWAGGQNIFYNTDTPDYSNGFLIFKIKTPQPEIIAREMIKKLNDEHIQPESFKEVNITQVAKSLDYNIFKNFMNYNSLKENETPQVTKKKGRRLGSKNKKSIDTKVSDAPSVNVESPEEGEIINPIEYGSLKSKYNSLTEKYGHPLTRTELNRKERGFYDELRSLESEGKFFDFFKGKRAPYGSKKTSKKKE